MEVEHPFTAMFTNVFFLIFVTFLTFLKFYFNVSTSVATKHVRSAEADSL